MFLQYAFRLLGRRSYTNREMEKKLMQRSRRLHIAKPEKDISSVLKRLSVLKYIDDEKILEDYFEYRLKARPQGKFAFLHLMHRRGIPFEKASAAWDNYRIDEEKLASELIEKTERRFVKLPKVLRRQKLARFLASRGFAPDIVWRIIETV